jgi:hypothetical protein
VRPKCGLSQPPMLLTCRPPIAESTFCQSGSDGITVASTVAAHRLPWMQQAPYAPCPVIHDPSVADDANVATSTTVPSESVHDASCTTAGPGGEVSGEVAQPGIFAVTVDACGVPEEQPASIVRAAATVACRHNLRMITCTSQLSTTVATSPPPLRRVRFGPGLVVRPAPVDPVSLHHQLERSVLRLAA